MEQITITSWLSMSANLPERTIENGFSVDSQILIGYCKVLCPELSRNLKIYEIVGVERMVNQVSTDESMKKL